MYRILPGGHGLDAVQFHDTRTDVRLRMRGGRCWQHVANSREPHDSMRRRPHDRICVWFDQADERTFCRRSME
jgi:hypothetical protein